ncbi:unnamed protein product [Echinostoma caproni]|uniref:Uncharacterized protein n=1 Tax=Echinostoma caproni TaxID=27848 RepID=A0A183ACR4_9TREM|nr:unnamed protein product [Echinostoma caproni]
MARPKSKALRRVLSPFSVAFAFNTEVDVVLLRTGLNISARLRLATLTHVWPRLTALGGRSIWSIQLTMALDDPKVCVDFKCLAADLIFLASYNAEGYCDASYDDIPVSAEGFQS